MSNVTELVERAWRDGIGPDDRAALSAFDVSPDSTTDDPATADVRLFFAWSKLLDQTPVDLPPPAPHAASRVVHAAAAVVRARVMRDQGALSSALARLDAELAALAAGDAHAAAARAWSDFALADAAAAVDDVQVARQRYEIVAQAPNPTALRIAAMLKLAAMAFVPASLAPARRWARRALTLAESAARPADAARARLVLGMLDVIDGDVAAAHDHLTPLLAHADTQLLARLVLASTQKAAVAMPLLADGLRLATERGDVLTYSVIMIIGSRRYIAMGKRADALVTITVGILELQKLSEQLAAPQVAERASWRAAWGASEYADVERAAMALLDHP